MDSQEENELKRKYSNIFGLKKLELDEEDKCCFHCELIDCKDTSPRCARNIFLKNRRKQKAFKKY